MEPIFEELARQLAAPSQSPRARSPRAFRPSEDGWEGHWMAPGVAPEELDLRVEDGFLHVAYTTAHGVEEGLDLHRKERRVGASRLRIPLPREADPETITANLSQGVLRLSVARLASLTPKKIEVKGG
ncbi:MAG: Hsp20/alpha crystallin family protein [Nannocystaceae bacterium]